VQEEQNLLHQNEADYYSQLRLEVQRWRDILAVPYAAHKVLLIPG